MANTESLWQELTVAALLGTQRRTFRPPEASGVLGSALRAAPAANGAADSEEVQLLRAASLAALHQRAGQLPAVTSCSLPPACPPDTWQRCSALAGSLLETILSGDRIVLLPEWVALATRSQRRIREEHLALLLAQTRATQALHKALIPVLGQRGRWLARLNPDWQGFDDDTNESIWQEGKRKQRLAYLYSLRERQPARARELLFETWNQESPAERVAFLQVFETGLSMADEPFLESVLDDRRKDVRAAAAGLLSRLPASRLVQRMTARARRLLTWKNSLLRSTLEVSLPETCDEAMQRDGIELKPAPRSEMGEKSIWLAQILTAVPPATWSGAWNRKPEQILAVAYKHEVEAALYQGWQAAASVFQDTDWLEALLLYDLRRTNRTTHPDLFAQLPVALQEKRMIALLREQPSLAYDQPTSVYLTACRFVWSQELTRAAVQCICAHLHKGDMTPWQWERLLREIAPYPNPELLPECLQRISTALQRQVTGEPAVEKLLAILAFRQELQQAFND